MIPTILVTSAYIAAQILADITSLKIIRLQVFNGCRYLDLSDNIHPA